MQEQRYPTISTWLLCGRIANRKRLLDVDVKVDALAKLQAEFESGVEVHSLILPCISSTECYPSGQGRGWPSVCLEDLFTNIKPALDDRHIMRITASASATYITFCKSCSSVQQSAAFPFILNIICQSRGYCGCNYAPSGPQHAPSPWRCD